MPIRAVNLISFRGNSVTRSNPFLLTPAKEEVNQEKSFYNIFYFPPKFKNYNVNFKGNSSVMMSEYQGTNLPILPYLKKSTHSSEDTYAFLSELTSDKLTSKKFINELVSDPTKSADNVKLLESKLGSKKLFLKWYYSKSGYQQSYESYLKDFYSKANSIEELVKFQPNWGYWALERKKCALDGNSYRADELMTNRNANFTIGQLPSEFSNSGQYKQLVQKMKTLEFGIKNYDYYLNNNKFNITQLDGGDLSCKNIYKIVVNNDKKYIIKIDRFYPEDNLGYNDNPYILRVAKEARLVRGDSIFVNACLDYYLQANGCKNNAKINYYDFDTDSALYDYVDLNKTNQANNFDSIPEICMNSLLKPMRALGIYPVDIGMNFNFATDANNNTKLLDLGHAELLDALKPGARLLTIDTPNLCGFGFRSTLASLNMSDLDFKDDKSGDFKDSSVNAITNMTKTGTDVIKGDSTYFYSHKKEIKVILNEVIRQSEQLYPLDSVEVANSHFNLIDFYLKDVECRVDLKIGAGNKDKVLGIMNAIKREIDNLKSVRFADEEILQKIDNYEQQYQDLTENI